MSSGTTATTQAMSVDAALATGANGPGKTPPAASPPAKARIVQTYVGTVRVGRTAVLGVGGSGVTPGSVAESGRVTSRSRPDRQ